ncbi:MAG: PIG-L family deacetylase [Propioniciclava sp.]
MNDLPRLLAAHRALLVVHAHPDDETLATGGLIAACTWQGVAVYVLTATRGEQGEVVPGSVTTEQARDLPGHREGEVACAGAALGVTGHGFLGELSARAVGRAPRRYTDSGMRWLDEAQTLAGPGSTAGPDALTAAPADEIAADIAAYADAVGADLLITYDADGGYGHPDHVALHQPTRAAARALGVAFAEIASDPDADGTVVGGEQYRAAVVAALGCYRSQLSVDGADVVHVGGQRQPIRVSAVLRLRR